MGRLLSTGVLADTRALVAHCLGTEAPADVVAADDCWWHVARTSQRPVLELEAERIGSRARLFAPAAAAVDAVRFDPAVHADAHLVVRRADGQYEALRLLTKPPARKARRSRRPHVDRAAVRRLARTGGVKRIASDVPAEIRAVLEDYLRAVLHDAVAITEYNRRRTMTTADVLHALHRRGTPLYR